MIPLRLACSKSKGEKSTHEETAVSISVAKCYGLSVVGPPDIGRQACMCQPSFHFSFLQAQIRSELGTTP